MAMEQKTKIIIETESGNTEAQLKKVANGLQDVGKSSKKAREQVGSSSKAMTTDLVAFATKAASALAAAKTAYNWTKEAANFQEVALYTKASTESMGLSFDRLVSASQRGANGMASAATIMKANLKALNAGLTASEDEFGRLWQIADAIGNKTGQTIEQTFEQITTAITSGNSRALISLGALPESFGKAGNAADLLNKKGEILKTVLSQLGAKADDVAKYGDTAADSFNKFEVAIEDFKNSAGSLLLPVLESIVGVLADIVTTGTKAINVVAMAMAIKPGTNQYNAYTVDELNALKVQKSQSIAGLKYQLTAGNAARDGSASYRNSNSNLAELGVSLTNTKAQLEAEEKELALIEEALTNNNRLAAKRAEIEEQTRQRIEAQGNAGEKNSKNADDQLAKARQIADMAQRLIDKYDNLAESVLPKDLGKTTEMFKLMTDVASQAALLPNYFTMSGEKIEEVNRRLAEMRDRMADEVFNAPSLLQANSPETIFANQGFQKQYAQLVQNAGLIMMGGGLSASVSTVNGLTPNNSDTKKVSKEFWSSIKADYSESIAAAMAQGIIDSNLGETLRSTISSIAASKASSYGSTLLSGLFSGNGFAGLGGAFSGFVGSLAVGAIANSLGNWWDSISKDKHKGEVLAANAETQERISKAWLNTYSVLLNPFLSSSDVQNIYDARYNPSNKYTISHEWKDTDWHWLTGQSTWRDTTPQSTFDTIARLESAINLANENSDRVQKEIELLETKGYSYQALSMSMDYLSEAFSRSQSIWENPTFSWDDGKKFSVDLSDSVQELTKAYYDALKQYGQETAAINTRNSSQYLAYAPFISELYSGTYYPDYGSARVNMRAGGYGGVGVYDTYDRWGNYADFFKYNRFNEITSDFYENRNANKAMFEMVKNVGENQYNLAALQINDPAAYAEEYLSFLEKQMNAAAYVMEQQEYIYADASKTFEEQEAALQMYQDAQNQYYNAKLEMLSAEQAKEEEIKKQQQQAALRTSEKMEALLGFTGEIARTGNSIYILEGANQIGALQELMGQVKDDPEAVAAIQALMKAANNQAKFGKI